ncbi:sigma-70 family RNA polymerase sigma factor [Porphyrobacter algicida]|uniref:Sigma-70 family RNA polymerase sigma factor n=1 Tax=Qipengyuania algicida TaxID=1836209 RepID=A0A845ALG0_9SPHN|nr:sigma-70 family RNA polymerase sigma factor [Qipengyuania algicida]MXP29721.1 sigma-70 family RNA polymerase sigma factor [Qipengyuania algicida]
MKPDEETMSRMARASQEGDRDAYRVLLSTAATWLSRYYAGRIASGQLDDLVQETLLAVHQKLFTYDCSRPFLPWLAAIARYRWIDALRQTYRSKETTIEGHEFAQEADQEVAAARISLRSLFAMLPKDQSQAIEMVKIEGLTIREASTRCGRSEAWVKVNIHRGLKRLQARVEKAN